MNGFAALELQKGVMHKLAQHVKHDSILKNLTLSDKWKKNDNEGGLAQLNFGES